MVIEKRFDHAVGALVEAGKTDQPVGVDGIRRAPDAVEGEIDLHRLANVGDRQMDAADPRLTAELADQVGGAVDAFRRQIGIEQERPPLQLRPGIGPHRQRPLQLALADVAPGAARIEDNLNSHDHSDGPSATRRRVRPPKRIWKAGRSGQPLFAAALWRLPAPRLGTGPPAPSSTPPDAD